MYVYDYRLKMQASSIISANPGEVYLFGSTADNSGSFLHKLWDAWNHSA